MEDYNEITNALQENLSKLMNLHKEAIGKLSAEDQKAIAPHLQDTQKIMRAVRNGDFEVLEKLNKKYASKNTK